MKKIKKYIKSFGKWYITAFAKAYNEDAYRYVRI